MLFGAMCVIWGVPYLMIRVAVREVSPATLVFLRSGLAALALIPLAAARGELRTVLPRWRPLLAFAAVEIAIPWLALSSAERRKAISRLPGTASEATSTSATISVGVCETMRFTVTPGASMGTTIMDCCLCRGAEGSVLPMKIATRHRGSPAPEIHHLRPLRM